MRIVVGAVFIAHGYVKCCVMGISGVQGFFTHLGAPIPSVTAVLITVLEVGGGIALILGFLTRIVAAGFVIDMLGAILLAKKTIALMSPKGIELELLLLTCAAVFLLAGPGALALDSVLPWGRSKAPAA